MSGYIKCFEYVGMNMSFFIKDEEVRKQCEKILGVIKYKLGIKFHSKPIYENNYLKTKVKEYDGTIRKWHTKRKYALYLHCLHYY